MDVLEEVGRALERRHEQGAARDGQAVDRLQPVPGPRLDALGQGVVDADRDVDLLGLVAGHVLLELFLRVRDDGEVLGGDAVALGAVAVAAEGDAPPPGLAGGEDDAAADARGEVLLEDAAVDDLAGEVRHAFLLERAALLLSLIAVLVGWSDHTLPPARRAVKGKPGSRGADPGQAADTGRGAGCGPPPSSGCRRPPSSTSDGARVREVSRKYRTQRGFAHLRILAPPPCAIRSAIDRAIGASARSGSPSTGAKSSRQPRPCRPRRAEPTPRARARLTASTQPAWSGRRPARRREHGPDRRAQLQGLFERRGAARARRARPWRAGPCPRPGSPRPGARGSRPDPARSGGAPASSPSGDDGVGEIHRDLAADLDERPSDLSHNVLKCRM